MRASVFQRDTGYLLLVSLPHPRSPTSWAHNSRSSRALCGTLRAILRNRLGVPSPGGEPFNMTISPLYHSSLLITFWSVLYPFRCLISLYIRAALGPLCCDKAQWKNTCGTLAILSNSRLPWSINWAAGTLMAPGMLPPCCKCGLTTIGSELRWRKGTCHKVTIAYVNDYVIFSRDFWLVPNKLHELFAVNIRCCIGHGYSEERAVSFFVQAAQLTLRFRIPDTPTPRFGLLYRCRIIVWSLRKITIIIRELKEQMGCVCVILQGRRRRQYKVTPKKRREGGDSRPEMEWTLGALFSFEQFILIGWWLFYRANQWHGEERGEERKCYKAHMSGL